VSIRCVNQQPNLGDAALAVANVAWGAARLPLSVAARLPGVGRMAADGAIVRARARSRLEALAEEGVDWLLAGRLPDAVARSALEHHVAERIASELARQLDVEVAVAAVMDHETTQRLIQAVMDSVAIQQAIQHVAESPEVRAALTAQSTGLAEEMVEGVRVRAESLDDAAERTVRGWLRRPRPA
jgi:hypothetical protein